MEPMLYFVVLMTVVQICSEIHWINPCSSSFFCVILITNYTNLLCRRENGQELVQFCDYYNAKLFSPLFIILLYVLNLVYALPTLVKIMFLSL